MRNSSSGVHSQGSTIVAEQHSSLKANSLASLTGHTQSWGKGYPRLLADCHDKDGKPLGQKGPMNPARNETYELLWTLLLEVAAVFPDMYIHLGGDEVPFECWKVDS